MYIVCLQLAAQCCHYCFESKDDADKAVLRKEMRQHIKEAGESVQADWRNQEMIESEYYMIIDSIMDCVDHCTKCRHQRAIVYEYLDKGLVAPYQISVASIRKDIEREERDLRRLEKQKAKEKRSGALSFEAALVARQEKERIEQDLSGSS